MVEEVQGAPGAPVVEPAAPVQEVSDDGQRIRFSAGSLSPDTFEVVAMVPGTANGLRFTEEVLRASVPLWEGVGMFDDHPGFWDFGRSVKDVAGVFYNVRYDGGVRGSMRCSGPQGELVQALAQELVADRAAGRPSPNIGLSADVYLRRDAKDNVVDIRKVNSLDIVVNPAAGGAFVRALNSQGGGTMPEETTVVTPAAVTPPAGVEVGRVEELARLQCEHTLDLALTSSGLPDPVRALVRARFAGQIYEPAKLTAAIEEQRDMLAKLVEAGVVKGVGVKSQVSDMQDSVDRVRFAWERKLGLPIPDSAKDLPRLSGIRELYHMVTGDFDYHGLYYPERATFAAGTKTTMANLVADGLNKILLQAYNKRDRWWEPIVTHRDLDRFQTMKLIRPYGFAALDTVSEGAPYTEKTWDDIKETATPYKTGNYVGLTLEMIMADDMDAVRLIPVQLGSAAWNTVADAVSYLFTQATGLGPTMADTGTLFNATAVTSTGGHANLLTTAFSENQLTTVSIAMGKQTEPGSSRRLGLMPKFVLVPTDLVATALIVRNTKFKTGSANNDANPWYEMFEVVHVPSFTETDHWACVADPKIAEAIVLGWFQGRREPEIFVADDSVVGSMFTNDEMRIKVRFFLCVGVADWRPLHKSNV